MIDQKVEEPSEGILEKAFILCMIGCVATFLLMWELKLRYKLWKRSWHDRSQQRESR